MNTCSDINEHDGSYPFTLEPDEEAPCSQVNIQPLSRVNSSRNVTIEWTYPYENELNENELILEGQDLTLFRNCSTAFHYPGSERFVDSGGLDKSVFGALAAFEITWRTQNSKVFDRECYFSWELRKEALQYEHSIEALLPGTTYVVNVNIFNVYVFRQPGGIGFSPPIVEFVLGPESRALQIATSDDVPDITPNNFTLSSARSNELTLSWEDLSFSNGIITGYELNCTGCPEATYTTTIPTFTVTALEQNSEYVFQVRAATSAGSSLVYSQPLRAETCPLNMRRTGFECFAESGNFRLSESEAKNCEASLDPTVLVDDACLEEGVSVRSIGIENGYWRPNVDEFNEIKLCPRPNYCTKERSLPDGVLIEEATNQQAATLQCSLNHQGTYCFSCDVNFSLSRSDGCIECTQDLADAHTRNFAIFVGFISFAVLGLFSYVIVRSKGRCCSVESLTRLVSAKFAILFEFFQVFSVFRLVLYPEVEETYLDRFIGFIFNFDLSAVGSFFRVECSVEYNHYSGLLVYTVPPLILFLMLFVLYKLLQKETNSFAEELKSNSLSLFFVVTFLIYPGVSEKILSTYFCESFATLDADEGTLYQSALRSDYRISCAASTDRILWLCYSALMVLVYPIGVVLVYNYYLRKHHNQDESDAYKYVSHLTEPYKNYFYRFEVYELIRKLVQTSGLVLLLSFLERESVAVIAQVLSAFFLVLLTALRPYKSNLVFFFALSSLALLTFTTQIFSLTCDVECTRKYLNLIMAAEVFTVSGILVNGIYKTVKSRTFV